MQLSNQEFAEYVEGGIEELSQREWRKDTLLGADGSLCAVGACNLARSGSPWENGWVGSYVWSASYPPAASYYLRKEYDAINIQQANDSLDSKEEAIKMMTGLAKFLREKG